MKRILLAAAAGITLLSCSALAQTQTPAPSPKKTCEELKSEIAAKLDAKGVKNYTLNIVKPDEVKDDKVVGSCEGGAKRITYKRN
jgi:hypothetical protein